MSNQKAKSSFKKVSKYPNYPFSGEICIGLDSLIPCVDDFYMGDFRLLDLDGLKKYNAELNDLANTYHEYKAWHIFAIDESFCFVSVNGNGMIRWIDMSIKGIKIIKEVKSIEQFIVSSCNQEFV